MQFIVSGQRIAVENFVTGKLYTILWKNDTQVTLTCISIGADCVVFQGEAPLNLFTLTMQNADTIDTIEPTQLGTTNYNNLINKPSINGVDLIGNKTSAALGIRDVPSIIESDDGKILTASSDGTYTWQPAPSSGTMDYTQLNNKPQINSVPLTGNVSLADLGAAAAADIPTTPAEIGAEPAITSENMLDADLVDDTSSTHKFATAAQLAQIGTNENNISLLEQMNGAKNYVYYAAPTETYTTGGANLTATNNGDGTMTMNGSTGTSTVFCGITKHAVKPMLLKAGQYILTGIDETAPVGIVVYITAYGASTQLASISSQYPTATFTVATDGEYTCSALVNGGKIIDNLTLKPMVCEKSVYDSGLTQFMPYAMSNAEITAWILSQT